MLDLRRLLDLLHGDSADAAGQPGLDNIEELLDGVRRAGLPTRLSTHGVVRPLPESLENALYRITQEMLTNAQRHGDGSPVEIALRYDESTVSVSARNGIRSPTTAEPSDPHESHSTPRGLAGIRKRASVFGGTIAYGPDAEGQRWETVAAFPLIEPR
jgi:signal transduction histidine kinase